MLRAGYVDVALIFRHEAEGPSGTPAAGPDSTGTSAEHAGDAGKAAATGSPDGEGLREQVLLDEPVNLIMPDGAARRSASRGSPPP